jgi:hypothetical protein
MKHLLNDMSEHEKNAIREQHTGGMKISSDNFSKLVSSKLGDVKPIINEQAPEHIIAKKVDNLVEIPEFQEKLMKLLNTLGDGDRVRLLQTLRDLGIDENSSAEEVNDIIKMNVSNTQSQDVEMMEEDSDEMTKSQKIKHKIADILHGVGAANIAAWGGVPAAILIGAFTGMPIGFAASWGATTLLMGLAKLLGKED